MQKRMKKFLSRVEEEFGKVKSRAGEIAEIVKEDASLGLRAGGHKLKELDLERAKLSKLYTIGKRTYSLYKQGLVTDRETIELCESMARLGSQAKKQHSAAKKLSRQIKFRKQ
ncbi:MAG: hypothetical protein KJ967_00350 [Elusimicrobia bacterium]|nr:hypothetical protein [Elusimicrobiota bacterium]